VFRTSLAFFSNGLLGLPWWQIVLATLLLTHVTIISVTVYLHRCEAHRALELHLLVSHMFRFWLWLTTGMVTGHWAAVHRKHHAKCETAEDPHSPQAHGIWKVLLGGAELYRAETKNEDAAQIRLRHAERLD
jgi:stearoyl-CoA desaturase (delta-9 desaturase)